MHPLTRQSTASLPCGLDAEGCYRAFAHKDAAFDGLFFLGVSSTGIYCRPVCRVRLPKLPNCHFFGTAMQAEAAGFRPCLRCRPELAPAQRWWSTTDALAVLAQAAAQRLDAALSQRRPAPSMTALAAQLGVSDRHLRRVFEQHWQVSPLQYLQTRRLLRAKQWLQDSTLPVTQVAQASGFGSVRGMNAAFAQHYRLTPRQLRPPLKRSKAQEPALQLSLAYRPPCQHEALWQFFQDRSLSGQEVWSEPGPQARLRRTVRWPEPNSTALWGWIEVAWQPEANRVQLSVSPTLQPVLPELLAQIRAWLDLDAEPTAVAQVIGHSFAAAAGLRVPGTLDGFELAVRAILGQQITVKAARTLGQRLLQVFGEPCATPWPELNRCFPAPAALLVSGAAERLGALGVVRQRQQAIQALAQAMVQGTLDLSPHADLEATLQGLQALPGIGPWTAQYIAMRALRWRDAWPVQDVALQTALGVRKHAKPAQALTQLGLAWQPFRSYALMAAWQQLAQPTSLTPLPDTFKAPP